MAVTRESWHDIKLIDNQNERIIDQNFNRQMRENNITRLDPVFPSTLRAQVGIVWLAEANTNNQPH